MDLKELTQEIARIRNVNRDTELATRKTPKARAELMENYLDELLNQLAEEGLVVPVTVKVNNEWGWAG